MCTLSLTLNFVVLKCSALVDEHPRGYGQEPWLLKCTVAACSGFYLQFSWANSFHQQIDTPAWVEADFDAASVHNSAVPFSKCILQLFQKSVVSSVICAPAPPKASRFNCGPPFLKCKPLSLKNTEPIDCPQTVPIPSHTFQLLGGSSSSTLTGGLIKPQLGGPIQVVNPKVKISAHALYSRLSITYFCTQISQNLIILERQYITCNELSVADDSWIA